MQQADCAHSATDTLASSGNHDDLSRRAIFAGMAGAAALLAVAPAPASAGAERINREWDQRLAHHDALKRHADDLWARFKSLPPSFRERVFGEAVEQACEARAEIWSELMKKPAPNLSALRWKLEQLLEIEDDGMSASWCQRLVRPTLADIARLMGGAA